MDSTGTPTRTPQRCRPAVAPSISDQSSSQSTIEDTEWPKLIDKLFDTLQVRTIIDCFVRRFHYYTVADGDDDLAELNRRHQQQALTLKTGSSFACLVPLSADAARDLN